MRGKTHRERGANVAGGSLTLESAAVEVLRDGWVEGLPLCLEHWEQDVPVVAEHHGWG